MSVATLRHRALPSWTAWIGVPVALINLVGPFAVKAGTGGLSPQGWFAEVVGLSFAVWLVTVSVAAWQRPALEPPLAHNTRVHRSRSAVLLASGLPSG